jgi:hypothetical protein
VLFHVLDPREIAPKLDEPVLLVDMETSDSLEVSPDYTRTDYRVRIDAHIAAMREQSKAAGLDYFLLDTSRPLDEALREYLSLRAGRM